MRLAGPACYAVPVQSEPTTEEPARQMKPLHYRGSHETRAKAVCAKAQANPLTRCWRCGCTMAEVRRANPGRSVRWQAGHVDAGNPNSELLAEDSLCNERDGQRRTQAVKASKSMPHSRRWADLNA